MTATASTVDAPKVHVSKTCIAEYADAASAREAALEAMASCGGRMYSISIFEQGGRVVAATAFPMLKLKHLLTARPAEKYGDVSETGNRPFDPAHVRAIQKYLVENYKSYVLPPLSITYEDKVPLFTWKTPGAARLGYMVVADEQRAHITDGMHRFFAIVGYPGKSQTVEGALMLRPELGNDSVAVQITIEADLTRIHQDFADMAQTKELPKSLLTAYDLRDPVNRLVHTITHEADLFKGRVDSTSTKLSKNARQIVLSNWVRNLVVGSIAPDYFIADEDVPRYVRDELSDANGHLDDKKVNELGAELFFLVKTMTSKVPRLEAISKIDPTSPEANKIPELRQPVLATTGVGLGICGMVLRVIRTEKANPAERRTLIEKLFADIRWERDGDIDSVWLDAVISDGGSISATRASIFTSAARIVQRLGLKLPERMATQLEKRKQEEVPTTS